MKKFQRILSNLGFALVVMLLFLLFFQNKILLPPAIQAIGRMHPLLLHLPIGLVVIAGIFWLTRKSFDPESFKKIFTLVLQVALFTAALSALMGFFLSKEGGYEEDLLYKHKILGIGVVVFVYATLFFYQWKKENKTLVGGALLISLLITIVGSHYGANITHGEGFVFQPLQSNEIFAEENITDSSTLFEAAVRPILRVKCFSCHNEKKSKGGLIMTSEQNILKGGKNGEIWKPGDANNSRIIQFINLPEDDNKHMPPNGKPQITKEEAEFLFLWVQSGADMKKRLNEYGNDDTLWLTASKFIKSGKKEIEKTYSFKPASGSTIEELNGPFCAVFPLSQNSPALQADFFVREKFDRENLKQLSKVKEQLVVLNLGNMPVTDDDMKTIAQFGNLEKLILNNSLVTSKGLEQIKNLKKLKLLSIAGTRADKNIAETISQTDSLAEIFIWNTGIQPSEAEDLKEQFAKIRFNTGFVPDESEILTLTSPQVKNEEFILSPNEKAELKHQISGVQIRYTTDGSIPDSATSPIYKDPIAIKGYTIIKTRAVKAGWNSSPVAEYSFYIKGIIPSKGEFINKPNEKYKGEGINTLFDNKKGPAESFSDPAWLGYREQPFSGLFFFDTAKTISSISISYCKSVQSYIMPPTEIEVWAGNEKNNLKRLKRFFLPQTTKEELNVVRSEGTKIDISPSVNKVYKLVVKNIQRLPSWHPGKGDKGWVFIDEIFFN